MLIKPRQTKELKVKINKDIINELEMLDIKAKELGMVLDISAAVEKFLMNEIPKVRKQLEQS